MNNYNGKVVIGTQIDTKQFDAQIKNLENKLNDIEASLQMASEDKTLFSTREIEEMEAEAERLRNQIGQLRGDFKKQTVETDKGFDRNISKIKRLGLSLFGIRSAYALVSRASSAYLSQDTELAQKLQSVWVGLGTFLAPALEAISDGLLKALGYLNVFIKALTGVDYIARANAKSLKKQADAQKQLAAGIDEITNLQDTSGDKSSGLIEIPELDDRIVKKLQNLARAIKENEDALKLLGIAFGAVLGYKAIKKIIDNIGWLVGSKGLGSIPRSISISLTLLGVTAIVAEITGIKKDLNELDAFTGGANKKARQFGQDLYKDETDINKLLKDSNYRRELGLETLEKIKTVEGSIFGIDKNYLENISTGIKVNEGILTNLKKQYEQKKLNKEEQKKVLENFIEQYNYNIAIMKILKENGIEVGEIEEITGNYADTINEIADGLGISDDKLNEMVKKSSENKDLTKGMYDNIKNINDIKLTDKNAMIIYDVDLNTKKAELKSENFFGKMGNALGNIFTLDWWKKIWKWAPDAFGNFLSGAGKGGGKGGGRGFADGGIIPTVPLQGVVYNPGPGVNIGGGNVAGEKGAEVIFPLQNSRFIDDFANQLAGKLGDGTNTQLLLELNRNIAELADRPIVLNVNGKSFAQATYQDYRNEQKRQNDNTQIVRS